MASNETRERILDAAERLFAGRGFGPTSLRTVIGKASVNLAAIHYHFGSKEALIRAVFARRLDPLNHERLRRLDLLEAAVPNRRVRVQDILEAFIRPAIILAEEDSRDTPLLALLLGRLHTEPDQALRAIIYHQFEEVSTRFIDALARTLPELPLEELYTRFHFVIGTMASSFADPQRLDFLSGGRVDPRDFDAVLVRMVTFLSAAMLAPATTKPSESQSEPVPSARQARRGRALPKLHGKEPR